MTTQDDNNGCYVSCSPGCLLVIIMIIAVIILLTEAL